MCAGTDLGKGHPDSDVYLIAAFRRKLVHATCQGGTECCDQVGDRESERERARESEKEKERERATGFCVRSEFEDALGVLVPHILTYIHTYI